MDMENIAAYAGREEAGAVLATVISVQGHAYRKEGAFMLLAEDGRRIGSVSPGCLEADLQARVAEIVRNGVYEVAEYNLSPEEDAIWGEAIGCGGAIRILLEPLTASMRRVLIEIGRRIGGGETVWLERHAAGGALHYCLEDQPVLRGGKVPFYVSCYAPRPRLIIFGAGEEAAAVNGLAQSIGFRAVIADWRPGLCREERFPQAEIIVGEPEYVVRRLKVNGGDFVMIASHHLRRDHDMFTRLLPLSPAYLGIVGSAKRVKLLLGEAPVPPFVKAPIGLPIGAEGAAEIAVSVAAELVAWKKRLRTAQVVQPGRKEA
ncbi:XdhC family protein [Paenibacillus chartarius]|uniref:XdhC family protein n=1 Tax=Paenibacillus chartarius TaxID=747481 RepID=A0ABV6DH15_9BACL